MTTNEPVDALASMWANLPSNLLAASQYAAVVQAEALTSLAADVKRSAEAYQPHELSVETATMQADIGPIPRDEHEAKLVLLSELKDQTERAEAAELQANTNADDLIALRAKIERIARDLDPPAGDSVPPPIAAIRICIAKNLRRALEGGE